MTSPIRLAEAREQARLLEESIAEARQQYGDVPAAALEAFLRAPLEDLRSLRREIDAAIGIPQVSRGRAMLWLRLVGGLVGEGRAPATAVGRVLGAMQAAAAQIGGYLDSGEAIAYNLPSEVIVETGFDLVAFEAGSAILGIAPQTGQLRVDMPRPLAELSLERLMRAVVWAESEDTDEALTEILPERVLRRQVLAKLKQIAPSSTASDFEIVEFSGPLVENAGERMIRVTPRTYGHASQYLKRRQEEPVVYQGQLVAIDVEKHVFDLRAGLRRIHCSFEESALKQQAKLLIEKFVEVKGTGVFQESDDTPHTIKADGVRRLTRDEQAALTG
jgi:hypothetical protein